jgi:serine protease Do
LLELSPINGVNAVMNRHTIFFVLLLLVVRTASAAEDRRERVMNDRKDVQAIGKWIYNDLPQGFTEAARTRKPMLVVFRCVP